MFIQSISLISGFRMRQNRRLGFVCKTFETFGRSACDYWAEEFARDVKRDVRRLRALRLYNPSSTILIQPIINSVLKSWTEVKPFRACLKLELAEILDLSSVKLANCRQRKVKLKPRRGLVCEADFQVILELQEVVGLLTSTCLTEVNGIETRRA